MTYQKTGNPPGRPRTKPVPEQPAVTFTHPSRPWDTRDLAKNGEVCAECWPKLIDKSGPWSVTCPHGTWFNIP